nr:reverse transcriptase domain-containing protein [Tanacetum cinerariifolium]
MPCECLGIIESKSKETMSALFGLVAKVSTTASTSGISPDVAELKDMVRALLLDKKGQSPTPVKAVEESCVTCGGAHSYRNCPATIGNNYRDNIQEFVSQASAVNFNQGSISYRPPMMSNQIRPPGFPPRAWDRFKDLLRACPYHGFSELHQLDTFYNALNSKDQDSLNFTAGGNFLDRMPLSTTASTSGISPDVAELKDMVRALLLDKKGQSPTPVKAVEESCVTCGGAHSYRNFLATDGNNYRDNIQEFVSQASVVNFNQGNTGYRPPMISNQIRPPGFPPVPNNQNLQRNNQNRFIPNQNQNRGIIESKSKVRYSRNKIVVAKVSTTASTSGISPDVAELKDMIANPRSDLKAITTRSGVSYDGPKIPPPPSSLPPVVENEPEATKDTVDPTNNGNIEDVQPQAVHPKPVTSLISEPSMTPVSASRPNPQASIPYPSRRNDERNRERAKDQIEKFYQIFKDMSFEISFSDALMLMPKFASTLKALIENKEKLSEM